MSKVRVYIPTTERPVQVERITREPAAQSAICVGRSTRVLPISGAYDSFVRPPSGVIEREFGPFDPGAFRLDVSAPVSDGESWQAGVFVAHALAAVGRLAGPDEPCESALWITGALDNDLKIGGVGHVPEKFQASEDLIAELASSGTALRMFVPQNNDEAAANAAGGNTYTAAGEASEILSAVGLAAAPSGQTAIAATAPQNSRGRLWAALLVSGVVVAGVGVFVFDKMQKTTPPVAKSVSKKSVVSPAKPPLQEPEKTKTPDPPVASAPPETTAKPVVPVKPEIPKADPPPFRPPVLEILELRAPTGSNCAAVQFGKARAATIPVSRVDGIFSDSKLPGLCGLEIGVDAGDQRAYAKLSLEATRGRLIKSGAMPPAFHGDEAFSGRLSWRFFVPKKLPRPLEYELIYSAGPDRLTKANSKTILVRHRVVP